MTYTLDVQTIGLILGGGAVAGLIVGLMAGLMMGGGEPSPPRRGLTRVLTLWRRKTDAALWVHLDDKPVASPESLSEEERTALARLITEMHRWLEGEGDADETAAPLQRELPPQKAAAPKVSSTPSVSSSPVPPAQPSPARSSYTPAPAPSRNPLRPFSQALQARKQPSSPASSLSIAAQVDEILQELLIGSPLEGRGLRLMELPGQGMVVMVGLEKFASVDEVPYDDVRKVLKIAVARWEEKMFGE